MWTFDRPRPLLFENYIQRCPPLATRVATVSFYQKIDPTKTSVYEIGSERPETLQQVQLVFIDYCQSSSY